MRFSRAFVAIGISLAAATFSRAGSVADPAGGKGNCDLQNIFFPLSSGAVWKYRVTVTDEGDRDVFTLVRRFVASPALAGDEGAIAGLLVEKPDVYGLDMAVRTPIRVVAGAVTEGSADARATGPEGFDWKTILNQGGFQLMLPEMKSLAVGASWRRSAALATTESTSKSALKGEIDQSDVARVLGLERVATPAGTFLALVVESQITGSLAGFGEVSGRVRQWYAPGVGLVKASDTGGGFIQELLSAEVQPCCGFVVVRVEGSSSIAGRSAVPGMGFSGSSRVSVPAGGRLDLALGDGTTVRLSEATDLSVETLCDEEAKRLDRTVFDLARGKILSLAAKMLTKGGFEVRTPSAVTGSRGTEFSVEVIDEGGRSVTLIEVHEGSVWVRPRGETGELVLEAGQSGRYERPPRAAEVVEPQR